VLVHNELCRTRDLSSRWPPTSTSHPCNANPLDTPPPTPSKYVKLLNHLLGADMTDDKHIDVEAEFDKFVRTYGGTVLKDNLPKNPTFNNADYVFPQHTTIAELKCLQHDPSTDPDFQKKVATCWIKWHRAGLLPEEIPDVFRSDLLPTDVFRELKALYSANLRGVIKKANRQIRETREALNLTRYKGLLLLASDGNYALQPKTLQILTFEILGGSCREIQNVVFFSVNMASSVPNSESPAFLWIPFYKSKEVALSEEAMTSLAAGWKHHHESLLGKTLKDLGLPLQ
jgi:hypothetical protein